MRYPVLGLAGLLLLTACATPNVNTPALSAEEVQRERELQTEAARNEQGVKIRTRETAYYMAQLERVAPRIKKAGIEVCQGTGSNQCEFGFKLVEEDSINAFADGKNVSITTGIMAFADSDDAVASILAHEYAHNVLGHVASTQRNVTIGSIGGALAERLLASQGIEMGSLSDLGGQYALMRYSKAFEQEADHVGLYIAARSGYNLDTMPNMWRRMAAADSKGIYTATTHPTYPERYIGMQQTINEIRAKQQSGQPLLPTFSKERKYF